MARGTPTYFSGTITGTSQRQDLYSKIREYLSGASAYQSNSVDAWEEYDEITATAGSRDMVHRSLGDRTIASGAGDAGLFIRIIENTTNIDFKAYQDWSTSSSTGEREAFSASYTRWAVASDTADIAYWGVLNEYEFAMVYEQSGTYRWCWFGSPLRDRFPSDGRGICRLSSDVSAGDDVVLSVDRDVSSSLYVGQKVWVYNQTDTGDALENDTVEIVEVTAIGTTPNTVTVDTLAEDKAANALIGLDPSPMGVAAYTNANPTVYFTNGNDGSELQTYTIETLIQVFTEGNLDPESHGGDYYYGSPGLFHSITAGGPGVRGHSELVSLWAKGAQSDEDRIFTDYAQTAAKAVKYFGGSLASGALGLAIGPGATS